MAAIVVGLDQLTKDLALKALADGPVDVIEGVLTLRLTYNRGGAFGLLQGLPGFFLVATIVVTVVVLLWARHLQGARYLVPLGLVLGGGFGNLADRIFRDSDGGVVDFVDLHVWPVFNLADSALVVGAAVLVIAGIRRERAERRHPSAR